ncbi:dolichyldiphosphatase 1-like [Halichondria panicea]|uniref:dolichyldiphosphatase 1-like n=1 Tax=Halichondria panicea TaxID=6063 RepID=UPI00312BAD09
MAGEERGSCLEESCGGPTRVAITLTHVQYPQGDLLGMVLAWFSLLPIFILIGFTTLILFRRDLHTIFFCLGVVLNEGCNFLLKHIIKEPRPNSTSYDGDLFVKYGMPSSHAQFMAFFATYFTVFLFARVKLSVGSYDYAYKGVTAGVAIMGMLCCCISRLYLGYHSVAQVLVGVGGGCLAAALWFLLVHFVLSPYFPHIFAWKVSEWLLIKDMSCVPNILWFEYTSLRQETRKRMRFKSQ